MVYRRGEGSSGRGVWVLKSVIGDKGILLFRYEGVL